MGKTVAITKNRSVFALCYFQDLNVQGIETCEKIQLEPLFRKIIKHVKMCLGGFKELQTYCRKSDESPCTVRPCRLRNMAAVTNKESHMPLFSFMFKYIRRLWCISARYFQLSHVNLYLLTFTALRLD